MTYFKKGVETLHDIFLNGVKESGLTKYIFMFSYKFLRLRYGHYLLLCRLCFFSILAGEDLQPYAIFEQPLSTFVTFGSDRQLQ